MFVHTAIKAKYKTAVFEDNTRCAQATGTQDLCIVGRQVLTPSCMRATQVSTTEVAREVFTLWQPLGFKVTGKVTRMEG